MAAFAGTQADALEALQCLHRPGHTRDQVMEVKLHHFVPRAVAGVFNVNSNGDCSIAMNMCGA